MSDPNKFDRNKHETYISCPRRNCSARNAPPKSDDFRPSCWRCGQDLGVKPVSVGDEVDVEVFDIHKSGAGLGRTDDGFIVMIEGVFPEKKIKARITRVRKSTADAELVEVIDESIGSDSAGDDKDSVDEDDDTDEIEKPDLGSRENFFGS